MNQIYYQLKVFTNRMPNLRNKIFIDRNQGSSNRFELKTFVGICIIKKISILYKIEPNIKYIISISDICAVGFSPCS